MDAEKKITKARVAMLLDHPFYGYLAMSLRLKHKEDMKPPTMGTNGRDLYYTEKFVSELSLKELQGVICHELVHCFMNHIPRRQNRTPERWNAAADYADNDLVLKEFPLPAGILHDPAYADMHVESIYNRLPADKDGGGGGGGTLDSHAEWDEYDQNDGNGDGSDAKGKAPSTAQQWREAVAQAATVARMQGKLPSHIEELVGDILEPKLDWKSILREMITSMAKNDFTISPPNKKHLYRGYYLPGITGEEITIACAIDTSGSISNKQMQEFLSEVHGICETYSEYTIYLYDCDAQIHNRWTLRPFETLPTVLSGRGGTDFRPVFEEVDQLDGITSLVYLTDLYGDFPEQEPFYETIWVATSEAEVPFGQVIRYPTFNDDFDD